MAESKIKWTTYTYNRWIGCTEVSPACDNCYARELNARHGWATDGTMRPSADGKRQVPVGVWGKGQPRYATGAHTRNNPHRWNRKAKKDREAAEAAGLPWDRPRVFCYSLADVLDTELPKSDLPALLGITIDCPELDFMLLTKRHTELHRIPTLLEERLGSPTRPNIWLGVTAENQTWFDRRVEVLMATPAAVHWVSAEPLLGPIRMGTHTPDLMVVGGESIERADQTARPMNPYWVKDLRDECTYKQVGFSFKQWGHYVTREQNREAVAAFEAAGGHAENPWKEGLLVYPVGADKSGHMLDGQEWEQAPRGTAEWKGGQAHGQN
jgi:protein gp37